MEKDTERWLAQVARREASNERYLAKIGAGTTCVICRKARGTCRECCHRYICGDCHQWRCK